MTSLVYDGPPPPDPKCEQCGMPRSAHGPGDGLSECPGDFPKLAPYKPGEDELSDKTRSTLGRLFGGDITE